MEENRQENRCRKVTVRLTNSEYATLEEKRLATTIKKLSDYLRHAIFERPVPMVSRNRSVDDMLLEMARLRTELNRIGNNFNQSVKKLHTLHETPQFLRWLTTHEIEKRTLSSKLDEIKNSVQKLVELWLQK